MNRRLAINSPRVKEPTTTIDTAQRNPITVGRLMLPAGILVIIMLLASCRGDGVGDWLGVVPHVITLSEEISHEDAAVLTQLESGGTTRLGGYVYVRGAACEQHRSADY